MPLTGLDLGTHSLKYVELEKKKLPTLIGFGSMISPEKSILSESSDDEVAYATYLAGFLADHKVFTNQAVIALPESNVFSKVITFPKMDEAGIKKALELSSEQYVPLSPKEASVGFEILGDSISEPGKTDVFVVASQRKTIEKIISVLKKAKIEVVGVETEMMALVRSLLSDEDLKASYGTVILNLGSINTDLAIVYSNGIRFTRSVPSGGIALTRAIAQDLGFDFNQAEEYKRSYGLDPSFLEGRIANVLKPIFEVTLEEVKRALAYFSSRNKEVLVKRMIISGGTASLPGVLAYLASELGIEVELGDGWRKIDIPSHFSANEISDSAASFAIAAGLALKEI